MRLRFEDMAHHAAQEMARRVRDSNTSRLFGFELLAAEPGRAVMRMKVRARHRQVHGVVHGGILAALADTAGALSCYLSLPRGTRLATVELTINYLEPVAGGAVLAEGKMLRCGKTFTVAECEVRDAKNRLVAKSLLTFAIIGAKNTKART
ncbi:MAG: PaaI family thioesterase [Acidobacteria bacterium]|nr:PaaI family thioesterase [Acidobacteriota bacterium]